LSHGAQVAGAACWAATRIVAAFVWSFLVPGEGVPAGRVCFSSSFFWVSLKVTLLFSSLILPRMFYSQSSPCIWCSGISFPRRCRSFFSCSRVGRRPSLSHLRIFLHALLLWWLVSFSSGLDRVFLTGGSRYFLACGSRYHSRVTGWKGSSFSSA
jgi:hypothetical protein